MKKKIIISVVSLAMVFLFPIYADQLLAADYAGNEDYYQTLCTTQPRNAECSGFKEYLAQRQQGLLDDVEAMRNNVAKIRDDITSIQKTIRDQQTVIDSIENLIKENDLAITRIQNQIVVLDGEIKQTEADIEKRDTAIKKRMVDEQANIGTNVYAEFVMGAKDLVDMIRIASGIEQITENDQNEIKALEKDKQKLNDQKEEQNQLKANEEATKLDNQNNKKAVEDAKQLQEDLMVEYQKQEADLLEQIRSADAAASAVGSKIIALNSVQYEASDGWIRPANGSISAHTFQYPGGGFHGGLDYATGIGSPMVAPIGGVVVYANNPYPSNNGYLGNYVGYPAGAGNSIHMVGTVNGTTYGISFFHLARENFVAYAGMAVSQGTFLAGTGHSGNSSGAHLHVEVINLGSISTDDAIAQFRGNPDFAWGTGWSSEATTCNVKGSAPCREKPEKFFGG